MKAVRITLMTLAAALIAIGAGTNVFAYHSGGVAECGGCHSMHSPAPGGDYLLLGTDQSSTCLNCHEHAGDTGPTSYHISTAGADLSAGVPPKQRTPGGDFGWLKKDYTFTVRGTTSTELGETHGHNIVADDYSYAEDSVNATAPGGSFLAANLACVSCHDPHGKYRRLDTTGTIAKTGAPIIGSGSYHNSADPTAGAAAVGTYRLLAGIGYDPGDGNLFTKDPPHAVAPSGYNRTEATTQTRVAYGTGLAEWCAQCHGAMHSGGANYVHPVSQDLSSTMRSTYDTYRGSGITAAPGSGYLSLVPFEEGISNYTTLKLHAKNDNTYLNGPASGSQVTCMSCHRAHATGWEYMLRWNMEGEFITYAGSWPGTDTTPTVPQFARGRVAAETQAAYYDRAASTFASYQRVLCNKCHAQD